MRASILRSASAFALFASVSSLPTITTRGSKFYTSDGDQWFVKGIAYQLTPGDPLLDTNQCQLDAELMKTLGTNAIRVYHVVDGDHSGCMKAFSDAGIYLFVDLDTFTTQVIYTDPMWTEPQFDAYKLVMDEFQQYDNVAGFFIGNEVINEGLHTEAAPFIKAATRDMKAYRKSKGYRNIPIGYSHADVPVLRPNLQNYLACGSDASESIDFFGLNAYEWCGQNTFDGSGYAALTEQIKDYPIPIFISETGCNTAPPRTFQDQSAIFGPEMTPYWSGAIIYEWLQEANHYGLISYQGDTDALVTRADGVFSVSGKPTPVTPDFSNLKTAWAAAKPSGTPLHAYTPSNPPPACPGYTKAVWEVAGNVALPSLGVTYNQEVQYSITAGRAPAGRVPPDPSFYKIFAITPAASGDLLTADPGTTSATSPSTPPTSPKSSTALHVSSSHSSSSSSSSSLSISSSSTLASSTSNVNILSHTSTSGLSRSDQPNTTPTSSPTPSGNGAKSRISTNAVFSDGTSAVFGTLAAIGALFLGCAMRL